MPSLEWVGKKKVVNSMTEMPYRVLNKRYSYGKENDDPNSGNMIIKGDNLAALKSLLPRFEGKVNCVYIDPPYNTGNEEWVYNDAVNDPKIKQWLNKVVGKEGEDLNRHDKWLCMMYPRLRLLQRLLADDGCLIISISHHELHNLVLICQEIFTTKQIVTVTVQTSGGKPSNGFNLVHEYLVFITPKDFEPNSSEDARVEYASPYHGMNLASFNQTQRPNQAYPIFVNEQGVIKGVGKSLQERIDSGEYSGALEDFQFDYDCSPEGTVPVWPVTQKGDPCVWRLISSRLMDDWQNGYIKVVPQNKRKNRNKFSIQYLSEGIISKIKSGELKVTRQEDDSSIPTLEVLEFRTGGVGIPSVWNDKKFYTTYGGTELKEIFNQKGVFAYPKPVNLIVEILSRVTRKDSIVLDSFAGSGTTGHAVLKLNKLDEGRRRFILVEFEDYVETITAERIRRVVAGYETEKGRVEGFGGSFSFYELGAPLLIDGLLNEEVGIEQIREYVYFTETKEAPVPLSSSDPYFLGYFFGTFYYFYYERERATTLDATFLGSLPKRNGNLLIYADRCMLTPSTLKNQRIIFKKIPRDIARF